ncbi:arylsulfatase B-like [Saccoglossus kowalevskii]
MTITLDKYFNNSPELAPAIDSNVSCKSTMWHLGFCKKEYLPTSRGFYSHYGQLGGGVSHWTKETSMFASGYDFRNNSGVVQKNDTYLTFMLAERAAEIIMGHSKEYPLYLHFNLDTPAKSLEVPPEYEALYSDIADNRTRKLYGMYCGYHV